MDETKAGAVLAISSHVVRGAVGNRAAVFALETRGHPVWALPTVVLPWHPGHGRSTRIALPDEAFDSACKDLAGSPKTAELAGVLTGYFASAGQVHAAARLIGRLRQANPHLVVLCDPVIGDNGGLYVAEAVAAAIRDHLLPLATIITPNRFELGWLTQTAPTSNLALAAAARTLPVEQVLVTSAFAMMEQSTGSLWVAGNELLLVEHRAFDGPPNGLGDLLASLVLSRILAGETPDKALARASASVFEIVARTVRDGLDELALAREASSLTTPMAMVQVRHLVEPRRAIRPAPVDNGPM